jgi:hypothetical protein
LWIRNSLRFEVGGLRLDTPVIRNQLFVISKINIFESGSKLLESRMTNHESLILGKLEPRHLRAQLFGQGAQVGHQPLQ